MRKLVIYGIVISLICLGIFLNSSLTQKSLWLAFEKPTNAAIVLLDKFKVLRAEASGLCISDLDPNFIAGYVLNSDGSPASGDISITINITSGLNNGVTIYNLSVNDSGVIDDFGPNWCSNCYNTQDNPCFRTGDNFTIIASNTSHYGKVEGTFLKGGNGVECLPLKGVSSDCVNITLNTKFDEVTEFKEIGGPNDTNHNVLVNVWAYVNDTDGLDGCFLESNNTGVFVNSTYQPLYGTEGWCNFSFVTNSQNNVTIVWYIWVKDYYGRLVRSPEQSFVTTNTPPVITGAPLVDNEYPFLDDNITGVPGEVFDYNNDTITYYWQWYNISDPLNPIWISNRSSINLTEIDASIGEVYVVYMLASDGYNNSTNWVVSSNNATVQMHINLSYPKGLYEAPGVYPKNITLNHFNITFLNVSINESHTVDCAIVKANGSVTFVNYTSPNNQTEQNITLTYYINESDPSGAYDKSWYIDYCRYRNENGRILFINRTDQPVYVKTDKWYFNASGVLKSNDAANAYSSKNFGARWYFSHNDASDRDIAFAVYKYSGSHEFTCFDGKTVNCSDPDCQTIFFEECGHPIKRGGIGEFSIKSLNLLKNLIGTLNLPSNPCTGNICQDSVGGATIYYTQEVAPNGMLKFRVIRNVPSPEIVFITLSNESVVPGWGFTNQTSSIDGPNKLPYKILLPSGNPPYTILQASSKANASDTGVFSGNIDMVFNVSLADVSEGVYNFSVDVYVGSAKGSKNFTIYVDNNAPHNWNESDSKLLDVKNNFVFGQSTNNNQSCNDGIDNDLDYVVDCSESECMGRVIGVTAGGNNVSCESPEITCWDSFDNNRNGKTDCEDSNCDMKIGGYQLGQSIVKYLTNGKATYCMSPEGKAYYFEQSNIVSSCNDSFDNNANGLIDCRDLGNGSHSGCFGRAWNNPLYPCVFFESSILGGCSNNIDDNFDANLNTINQNITLYTGEIFNVNTILPKAGYGTGKDCDDYSCKGSSSCPKFENRDASGNLNPSACFDGIDNALIKWEWNNSALKYLSTGREIDCKNPDCLFVVNPLNPLPTMCTF